jgi:hypothetical protein
MLYNTGRLCSAKVRVKGTWYNFVYLKHLFLTSVYFADILYDVMKIEGAI